MVLIIMANNDNVVDDNNNNNINDDHNDGSYIYNSKKIFVHSNFFSVLK